ncbi:MAG: GLPGLI family protein, partial [Pedobacter sp.]
MKNLLTGLICLMLAHIASAQEVFIPHGKINFEKRVNMVRTLEDNKWLPDDYKDKMAKYQASNWTYTFTEDKSLYKAGPVESSANSMFFFGSNNPGQIYTDLANNSRVINKGISGVDYLLKDTIPKLEWKIYNEVRNIAGYECRKAVARFNDTVYVVAFYTDKILTKG